MARLYNAGGTIVRARFVRLDTTNNQVVQCIAGERAVGISQMGSRTAPLPSETTDPPQAAQSGEELEIHLFNEPHPNVVVEVGTGGVTAGDPLVSDANGKAVLGSGAICAYALETVAAGGLCPVVAVMANGQFCPTIISEFDCETLIDTVAHPIIPASLNKHGLWIVGVMGIVTEVFGGASEDQGVVTVRDGSGNAIATLTPSDAGADALKDTILGLSSFAAATGVLQKTVAAGVGVEGIVTQFTSGASAAGKMKVVVLAVPLG